MNRLPARAAADTNSARTRSMSYSVMARGTGQPGPKARAEGVIVSHEPSSAPWILERFVGCVSSQ
jgi:hypothetical protein